MRFILFHRKSHPDTTREPENSQYLTYLATQEKVAANTQNQDFSIPVGCALRRAFLKRAQERTLHRVTLKQNRNSGSILGPQVPLT